jgi:hypothetical protein
MRSAGILAVVALAMTGFGQESPGPARSAAAKRVDLSGIPKMESLFEQKLRGLDTTDPMELLGACSGVYLSGYGLVFTIPLSLVKPPEFSPFTSAYTPQKAEVVHKRKLAHLPALRKALSEMLIDGAKAFPALPPNEKIVVAARLFYLDYEDKTGLPNQMVVSALGGIIQPPEEQ